jgi:hypothetical protein
MSTRIIKGGVIPMKESKKAQILLPPFALAAVLSMSGIASASQTQYEQAKAYGTNAAEPAPSDNGDNGENGENGENRENRENRENGENGEDNNRHNRDNGDVNDNGDDNSNGDADND